MKISKYLTVSAIAITILSTISHIAVEGFNEEVWNKIVLLFWMGNSLTLLLYIEKLEDENRDKHNQIVEAIRQFKKFKTHHNL
jgi:hypothetical protein